jgi:hypothetical protein
MTELLASEREMKKTIIQGRFSHKLRSMAILGWIVAKVLIRRALGRGLVAPFPMSMSGPPEKASSAP